MLVYATYGLDSKLTLSNMLIGGVKHGEGKLELNQNVKELSKYGKYVTQETWGFKSENLKNMKQILKLIKIHLWDVHLFLLHFFFSN